MIEKITKDELVSLINSYNNYIQNANDSNLYNDDWKPVCIEEFYQNDYKYWCEHYVKD